MSIQVGRGGGYDAIGEEVDGNRDGKTKVKLGTWNGVYLNSINSILGVLVFLRWAFVTGQAGIGLTFAILSMGFAHGCLTLSSVCAIVTNFDEKQMVNGGLYFYITRSVGIHIGGTFGMIVFLTGAIACGFVSVGFGEAFVAAVDGFDGESDERLIALACLAATFAAIVAGIDKFTKISLFVLFLLIFGLFSGLLSAYFMDPKVPEDCQPNEDYGFAGNLGFEGWSVDLFKTNFDADFSSDCDDCPDKVDWLWVCSLVYPSMMGIFGGVNISGDLRDAGKSIPLGSYAGICTMFLVYGFVIVSMGGSVDRDCLRRNTNIVQDVSYSKWVVFLAILSGAFSTALATLLGTARILERVAQDRLFPWLSSILMYKPDEASSSRTWISFCTVVDMEKRSILLTICLSFITIMIGTINQIAPIVLHVQLFAFAAINYSCFRLRHDHDIGIFHTMPWNPTYKFYHKYLSLFGVFSAFGISLMVDYIVSLLSLAFVLAIYFLIRFINPKEVSN